MNRLWIIGSMLALFHVQAARGADEPAENKFSFEAEINVPTSYVFRGVVFEEDHFLVQPEFTLGYTTAIGDIAVTPYINVWTNFTDAPAPGEPEWFNEIDVTLGAEFELPHDLTLGVSYIWYNSPADAFDDIHELGLTLTHADPLNPSIGLYREISNHNGEENTYIELSLTPGWDVPQIQPLHLDFPLVLGMSPDEYYTDSDGDGAIFGYASAGVVATYAINECVSVVCGVEYIQMLADSTEASNDGDEFQVVGRLGLTFSN